MYRIQEEAFFSSRFSLTWHRDKCIFSAGERSNFSVSGNKLLNGAGIRPSGEWKNGQGKSQFQMGKSFLCQLRRRQASFPPAIFPFRLFPIPFFPARHSFFFRCHLCRLPPSPTLPYFPSVLSERCKLPMATLKCSAHGKQC